MLSALRFARHSETVLAQLVRTGGLQRRRLGAVGAAAGDRQRQLGLGAAGFGFLMGCLGAGAVIAGLLIGRCAAPSGWSAGSAGCVSYALVMLVAAFSRWRCWSIRAGGRWRALDGGDVDLQHRHPDQRAALGAGAGHRDAHAVRAGRLRHRLGVLGRAVGPRGPAAALCVAACAWLAGLLLARPFPLRMGERARSRQASPGQDLFIGTSPTPRPARWRWRSATASAPTVPRPSWSDQPAARPAPARRRDLLARLPRPVRPARYVERFIVTSWADYLHQRARATMADQELEARVRNHPALRGRAVGPRPCA
jgi:hypothetical protein